MKDAGADVAGRSRSELMQQPGTFLEQASQANHRGGGILGRAAEFLASEPGL
jgi:hypothetical protein